MRGLTAPTIKQSEQRLCVGVDFLSGWRATPGAIAATNHFVRLISITTTSVLSGSKAAMELLQNQLRSHSDCVQDGRPVCVAKPLSIDLRQRVLVAVGGGMSRRQTAERSGVSAASAIRWRGSRAGRW